MKLRSTATLATLLTGIGSTVGGTAYALAAGSASPVSLTAATTPSTTAPAVQPAQRACSASRPACRARAPRDGGGLRIDDEQGAHGEPE
jgi:hypothetical protein